jgi:hypothetical protein
MAVYTPAQLIPPTIMGNGAANIATWRKRDTSNVNIHRTTTFASVAARAVTVEVGATAADTAAQKIMDAEILTVNVVLIKNWWVVCAINDYFEGFANNTDVVGSTYGYTYA